MEKGRKSLDHQIVNIRKEGEIPRIPQRSDDIGWPLLVLMPDMGFFSTRDFTQAQDDHIRRSFRVSEVKCSILLLEEDLLGEFTSIVFFFVVTPGLLWDLLDYLIAQRGKLELYRRQRGLYPKGLRSSTQTEIFPFGGIRLLVSWLGESLHFVELFVLMPLFLEVLDRDSRKGILIEVSS